jgi:hypothetical protein
MMNTKISFGVLALEVSICFAPITLLWGFGVLMFGAFLFDGWGIGVLMIPVFILLFLGGLGLMGLYQMMVHIYHFNYEEAEKTVYRKLYAGIMSLAMLSTGTIIDDGFSVVLIIYLLPILCSLHLIYLTKSKKDTTENSIFDDQVI